MSNELVKADPVNVDIETLKYLGYNPTSIQTRALVALAVRYELDPLLGEIQLINTKQGSKVYISRDGMLAIAHRSGRLDGIVVDEQRRNSEGNGWTAYVSVWRKDMSHPFKYGAQCKDSEPQAKDGKGPEMALARAERRALRRAFVIHTDFYPGQHVVDVEDVDSDVIESSYTGEELLERASEERPTPPGESAEPVEETAVDAPDTVDMSGLPDGYGMTGPQMLLSIRRLAIETGNTLPTSLTAVSAPLFTLWKANHNTGGDPF